MVHVEDSMCEYPTCFFVYNKSNGYIKQKVNFIRPSDATESKKRLKNRLELTHQVAKENLHGLMTTRGHPRFNKHALFLYSQGKEVNWQIPVGSSGMKGGYDRRILLQGLNSVSCEDQGWEV